MGDLQTLLPGFQNSIQALHTALLGVCLVLGFAGLVREVSLSYQRGSLIALPPYMVKMLVAFVALGLMQVWAGYLSGMVTDLDNQIGVNKGNVLSAYMQALATKFGTVINSTGTAATSQNAANAQINPSTGFYNGSSRASGGVNIYDPNNTITFDGAAVASIDGTTPVAGFDTGIATSPVTLFTAAAMGADGLAAFFLGMFVLILCVIGMFLMWLFSLLQQFLTAVAIGVSPIFFGLLLIRGLDGVASRFLTGFVGLCLWPLGWGIANLVTALLLDFALNAANNVALSAINYLSGGVLWWLGLGLWTIGSTLAAPWMITRSVMTAQPGIAALLGEMRRPAMGLASYTVKLGGFGGGSSDSPAPAPAGGDSLAAQG